jgi:hypothetical protein
LEPPSQLSERLGEGGPLRLEPLRAHEDAEAESA